MSPFGCAGGVQKTIAVLSEVPTTRAISTTPAAKEKYLYAKQAM